ncbi:MAG: hypothetical protein C0518_15385 [Opitutus sp.]|nr:hypothetical protein [Opitutus sp.]
MNIPLPVIGRAIRATLLFLGVLLVTGCLQTTAVAPKPVRFDENSADFDSKFKLLKEEYDSAVGTNAATAKARVARDRLIFSLRVEIDKWYAQLEQDLYESRASFNSWGDFLELGMAGAGAIATPVHTKTVWATLLSATKGTRLSIDKNWFREKATESLINAMRAGRNLQLAQIISKMTASNAAQYTFEEAWGDLISYHQAGTLQGGLVLLAATSGEQAKEAEDKAEQAQQARYPALVSATPAMITETTDVRTKALALPAAGKRAVLTELQIDIPADADDAALAELINTVVRSLATATAAERKKIVDAINKQPNP